MIKFKPPASMVKVLSTVLPKNLNREDFIGEIVLVETVGAAAIYGVATENEELIRMACSFGDMLYDRQTGECQLSASGPTPGPTPGPSPDPTPVPPSSIEFNTEDHTTTPSQAGIGIPLSDFHKKRLVDQKTGTAYRIYTSGDDINAREITLYDGTEVYGFFTEVTPNLPTVIYNPANGYISMYVSKDYVPSQIIIDTVSRTIEPSSLPKYLARSDLYGVQIIEAENRETYSPLSSDTVKAQSVQYPNDLWLYPKGRNSNSYYLIYSGDTGEIVFGKWGRN